MQPFSEPRTYAAGASFSIGRDATYRDGMGVEPTAASFALPATDFEDQDAHRDACHPAFIIIRPMNNCGLTYLAAAPNRGRGKAADGREKPRDGSAGVDRPSPAVRRRAFRPDKDGFLQGERGTPIRCRRPAPEDRGPCKGSALPEEQRDNRYGNAVVPAAWRHSVCQAKIASRTFRVSLDVAALYARPRGCEGQARAQKRRNPCPYAESRPALSRQSTALVGRCRYGDQGRQPQGAVLPDRNAYARAICGTWSAVETLADGSPTARINELPSEPQAQAVPGRASWATCGFIYKASIPAPRLASGFAAALGRLRLIRPCALSFTPRAAEPLTLVPQGGQGGCRHATVVLQQCLPGS